MRIIAGEFKSRRLAFIKSPQLRPTMDRVKESLFNVLGEAVKGKAVLDLFAGCGSLGLEALSRGAKETTFVDSSRTALQVLVKNIASLSLARDRAKVLGITWMEAIRRFSKTGVKFDLVLLDPPYSEPDAVQNVLLALGDSDILRPVSWIAIEHTDRYKIPEEALKTKFKLVKNLIFGGTALSFLVTTDET